MSTHVRRQFEGTPAAIQEARRFLHDAIADRLDPETQSDLSLALSELATNAVRHARTPFDVVVETDGHVRVEVEDHLTSFPFPEARPDEGGGHGLAIVDQLCDRWGVHIAREKKCVWCERDLPDDASDPLAGPSPSLETS
jgi:anti-sigma regulatory factor (Ser/Thr protein kinase)